MSATDEVINRPRIIRSLGYVVAHDADAALAAAESGIDALGMDLEDLTLRADKQAARELFPELARELHSRGVTVMARVNRVGEGADEDLDAVVCPELHCVNLAKVESADEVEAFCALLDEAERRRGLPAGHVLVRPVIETAAGIRWAYEIAAAPDRVAYMGGVAGGFWGDLGATLGLIAADGSESLYLRSKVLVDVRAAGVPFPIGGGMPGDVSPENLLAFMRQTKHLGYTGAFCRPSRSVVDIVHEAFTPTPAELAEWRATVPLLEAARSEGRVVFREGDRSYDTAGLQRVLDLLELADRLGLD